MNYCFAPLSESDREPVIDIFNHYVENSFAAYAEEKLPYEFFDFLLQVSHGYPAIGVRDTETGDHLIGFAFMRPYHAFPSFRRTAEVTYFISPKHTQKGIGRSILGHFIEEASKLGVDSLLASISSLNEQSISFHKRMGFEQCGRFRRIGRKFGKDFDVIWMQRLL